MNLDRRVEILLAVAGAHPELADDVRELLAAEQALAVEPAWMPRPMPGPGELQRSPCGWYWRPHPDPVRKHVETVFECRDCAKQPENGAFHGGPYRAVVRLEVGAEYRCHLCERTEVLHAPT